jgi:hypothetical protein
MTDIATIGSILGSIKAAADIAKLIKDSGSTLEQAEINYKISELVGALAEAKLEIAEIQNILLEKDEYIAELKKQLQTNESVFYEGRYYWSGTSEKKDGPFCQRCYDADGKLIRLQFGSTSIHGRTSRWYNCKVCEKSYDA